MNILDVGRQTSDGFVQKKIFTLKPPDNNGFLLNIIQNLNKANLRFLYCDFQLNGNLLALSNGDACISIIDFLMKKFWFLRKIDSCKYIKFCECNDRQIMIGKSNGVVEVLNVDDGSANAKLLGHKDPVNIISFTESNTCLSASKSEAIIWNLSTYNKLHVLTLEKECSLKYALFLPVSFHILVCYKDDIIEIWKNNTFQTIKQFHPSNWRNYSIKSLSFSRNGKVMVISGYLPVIAIFQLDIWRLLKIINLPESIFSVKKVQFIPQNFDGGCNKLLAILSGSGVVYFYDIENNTILSELRSKCKITNFSLCLANVQYIACILSSGEVEVYDANFYTMKNQATVIEKAQEAKTKLKNYFKKSYVAPKFESEKILEIDKIKSIIKEYKEFPETFRVTIWERILKLPNNKRQYNNIINHVGILAFENLQEKFPLEDKVAIRCLRHLLNNLATWCPFFAQVDFLPCLLFPFVKLFHKKPIACFELCCTIIINWCQHWFEYHPLPPLNVLAVIDNLLIEHDATLLQHFSQHRIKPILYSWSMLETAFSEVLTAPEWLMFWDHVFINEPSFLLCGVVAFLMTQKKFILLLNSEEAFYQFFHLQKPLDVKRFLNKTYHIMNFTSNKNHPRQYFTMFTCLSQGSYPNFEEYPKEFVEFQVDQVGYLQEQSTEAERLKQDLLSLRDRNKNDEKIEAEENKRMIEVQQACFQKIRVFQEHLKQQQEELKSLRQELLSKEDEIVHKAQHNLRKFRDQSGALKMLNEGLDMSEDLNKADLRNIEEAYNLEKLNLTGQQGEESHGTESSGVEFHSELSSARKEAAKLREQIKEAKSHIRSPRKAHIALTISSMNNLVNQIRTELERDAFSSNFNSVNENLKVYQLERETKKLQNEISHLVNEFSKRDDVRRTSSSSGLHVSEKRMPCSNKTVRFNTHRK